MNGSSLASGRRRGSATQALRHHWLRRRDRLLVDARFQRWASHFPLTRWLVRRRVRQLFDLTAGFVYSQVLLACVQLRLFEQLRDGPRDLARIAEDNGLPVDGADCLLRAAASLRLVEARGTDRYGLGDLGAALLGTPSVAAMVHHHRLLYQDLADPLALLRNEQRNALAGFWPYDSDRTPGAVDVAAYSDLMGASQEFIADDVLRAYPLAPHRRLMDLAGGDGSFVRAALRRWPGLQATLLDLPPVAERARERFAAAGLDARARAVGGDLLRDELPGDADLISLVRVLHDHPDESAHRILARAVDALPPGGRLLVAEPMAGTPGAEPVGAAYFGFYLRAMGSGRPRSAAELLAMMRTAGLEACRELSTDRPILVRVLVGDKPG